MSEAKFEKGKAYWAIPMQGDTKYKDGHRRVVVVVDITSDEVTVVKADEAIVATKSRAESAYMKLESRDGIDYFVSAASTVDIREAELINRALERGEKVSR